MKTVFVLHGLGYQLNPHHPNRKQDVNCVALLYLQPQDKEADWSFLVTSLVKNKTKQTNQNKTMKDNIRVRPCPDGIIGNNRGKHIISSSAFAQAFMWICISIHVYTHVYTTHACAHTPLTLILLVLLFLQHRDTLPHMKQRLHKIRYTPERMNEQVNTYLI